MLSTLKGVVFKVKKNREYVYICFNKELTLHAHELILVSMILAVTFTECNWTYEAIFYNKTCS